MEPRCVRAKKRAAMRLLSGQRLSANALKVVSCALIESVLRKLIRKMLSVRKMLMKSSLLICRILVCSDAITVYGQVVTKPKRNSGAMTAGALKV